MTLSEDYKKMIELRRDRVRMFMASADSIFERAIEDLEKELQRDASEEEKDKVFDFLFSGTGEVEDFNFTPKDNVS